jgi:hypothetical protein
VGFPDKVIKIPDLEKNGAALGTAHDLATTLGNDRKGPGVIKPPRPFIDLIRTKIPQNYFSITCRLAFTLLSTPLLKARETLCIEIPVVLTTSHNWMSRIRIFKKG